MAHVITYVCTCLYTILIIRWLYGTWYDHLVKMKIAENLFLLFRVVEHYTIVYSLYCLHIIYTIVIILHDISFFII